MQSYLSRAGRWPLALTLITIAACADDQLATEPRAGHVSRQAVDGNVILVTNASGANVPGSLPWAVSVAGGTSVIQFDASLAGDTIPLETTLDPFSYITIEGPTTKGITITSPARIIRLRQGGVLRNLILTGGSDGPGAAIWTQGPLRLEHSTVTNNHGNGAAIHGHDMTLVNSTVSGNSGYGAASAISIGSSGQLTLINSTVANNEGAPSIGWLTGPGGSPSVTLRNSIVATGPATRSCGDFLQYGHEGMNITTDGSCGASSALFVADPLLGGLADNGGPTPTVSFSHLSPALNAGVDCSVGVDQRYVSRGTSCDIGAFEFTDFTVVTLTIDANAVTSDTPVGSAVVTGTVRCSRTGDQFGVVVDLEQQQKVGKNTTVVRGTSTLGVACTTSPQPWSAVVTPATGAFATGTGSATARTNDVPGWTTPASVTRTVKLVRPRR